MSVETFSEFERSGWQRAAPHYEECWTDTALFVEPLLDAVALDAGRRLLDIACGPGFVSEAAAVRGALPIGLDVAPAMVERARLRCPELEFVEGDAQRLPFPDAAFDAATMNFGILHLAEPEAALAEACRVLVAGGRFALSSWIADGNAEDEITAAALAEHGVPVEVPPGPSYYALSEPGESLRALTRAGFDPDTVQVETVRKRWHVPSAEHLFEAQLRAGVRTAAVLRAQPPDRLARIRAAMVEAVRRHAEGDDFVLPIAARVISATRRS
jgi:SAM-dependent methyltransferase